MIAVRCPRAQEAVNLARVRAVLERVLPDVPRQREEAAERQASMDALKDYFTVRRGAAWRSNPCPQWGAPG